MIPVFGCETARELIDAFVDNELTMPQQVAMQRHIRSCRTCSAHVDDMSLISWSMKTTPRTYATDENTRALVVLQSDVLARVRAERALSLRTRFAEMFSDMRLVWPALGASGAVILCLIGASSVWHLTTMKHPHSVPAMLERYANAGSEANPLRLDQATRLPVILNEGLALDGLPGGEADGDLLIEALFTRAGHVVEARQVDPPSSSSRAPGRNDADDVLRLMAQWRLTPAQSRGGRPVAVRTLIYFSTTTVTAALRGESFDRARRIGRPKEAIVPSGVRSSVESGSAAA